MKHLSFLMLAVFLAAWSANAAPGVRSKPNILLIVSDDAGYADFGFHGCKDIPTPHLDKLAGGGLRFSQGCVPGCVCSPSCAGMLSGKTPARIGHENDLGGKGGIDAATELLPTFLGAAGANASTWKDSDDVNLLPFLTGQKAGRPHETPFWRFNVVAAVRDGDWKLIRIRDAAPLLFNPATDLAEKHNLASTQPERVAKLLKTIEAWEKPFPGPRWTEGDNWERIHVKDHVGPADNRSPTTSPVVNQE